jgi:zinc protease
MESDRMGHLLGALDQKTLDLQRGVVQNEKRQGENQPYGVTRQLITQNTYPAGIRIPGRRSETWRIWMRRR